MRLQAEVSQLSNNVSQKDMQLADLQQAYNAKVLETETLRLELQQAQVKILQIQQQCN